MIPVETTPGINGRGGGNDREWLRGQIHVYLIYCKNPCKCHIVSPFITTIKGKKDTYIKKK
jgi:hypothetical protein